jgi:LAS superfamily LD-carboxypeptidase LdcB
MRPDVARAFDSMAAAARRDGIYLIVVSGYGSDGIRHAPFARAHGPVAARTSRTALAPQSAIQRHDSSQPVSISGIRRAAAS